MMEIEKIMEDYEKLRSKKTDEKNMRVDKIYKEYPEIEEIDKEINLSGMENVRNILNNKEKGDEINKNFKIKVAELNKKRNEIIKKNGIDPEFDKIKFECERCHDTGFTPDGKRCICFKQKLINLRYRHSNLEEILKRENFDTFSFDYYSKENDGNHKLSPYDNMKKIYNRAVTFCDNFDNETKGLVFYGDTGLGKTFLSSCIAKKLMDSGKVVIYISAPRLFMIYEDYRFNRLGDEDIINDIYSADLLIIDDLGTEYQNKNNLSFLFDLMGERLSRGKKLLINTNYNMNELTKMYSSRFTSRIYEYFIVYGFYGNDIRIEKLKNR